MTSASVMKLKNNLERNKVINAALSQMELLVEFQISVYIVSQCSALKLSSFKQAAKQKNWKEMLMSEMFPELWSSWYQPVCQWDARLRLHHSLTNDHASVFWLYPILSRISHTLHFPHEKERSPGLALASVPWWESRASKYVFLPFPPMKPRRLENVDAEISTPARHPCLHGALGPRGPLQSVIDTHQSCSFDFGRRPQIWGGF